jgi:hypothetical protein
MAWRTTASACAGTLLLSNSSRPARAESARVLVLENERRIPILQSHPVEDMERPALACYDRLSGVPGVSGTIAGYYQR